MNSVLLPQQCPPDSPAFMRQFIEGDIGVGLGLVRHSLERIGYFLGDLLLLLAAERTCDANIDIGHGLFSSFLMRGEIGADVGKYLFKHIGSQTPGLSIVTTAMVAVI